jgi:hypothetical protein
MASISRVQHEALADGFIDLIGTDTDNFEPVELSDTANTIVQLAAAYVDLISNQIDEKDVASSGKLQNLITPTNVEFNGTTYSIGINAPFYASYQDEGVNGWAVNRNSRFTFKTRGVNPDGEMVKSIKQWIQREGASARNVKQSVSKREAKGRRMPDATTRAAVRASYFIKRKGIKPTYFWKEATNEFLVLIEKELGIAIKIDVINNLTQ